MKIALDTSVIIEFAALGAPRHAVTEATVARYRAEQAEIVVAEPALLESFSVLSRAPAPIGMPAAQAERLLLRDFGTATIAPMHDAMAWRVIRYALARGQRGGRVYDAAIAMASYEAGARLLLTWNLRDFLMVAPVGLEIRTPE